MRFAHCLVPIEKAYDFSWRAYTVNTVTCVVWVTLTIICFIALLFGTVLEQVNYDHDRVQEKVLEMAEQSILDYECAGSRVWVAITAIVVPNVLILFKILSN